jgi:3-oxoacyl-[acyl-carrier-protein] synthase III
VEIESIGPILPSPIKKTPFGRPERENPKERLKMDLKDKYAIVGVGYTPQGKVPGRTTLSFHLEACANAIADAGLKPRDVDGLIVYRHFTGPTGERDLTPYLLAQHLGIAPTYAYQDAN